MRHHQKHFSWHYALLVFALAAVVLAFAAAARTHRDRPPKKTTSNNNNSTTSVVSGGGACSSNADCNYNNGCCVLLLSLSLSVLTCLLTHCILFTVLACVNGRCVCGNNIIVGANCQCRPNTSGLCNEYPNNYLVHGVCVSDRACILASEAERSGKRRGCDIVAEWNNEVLSSMCIFTASVVHLLG